MKTERFEFTLPKDLKKALEKRAKIEKESQANIVTKALTSYLLVKNGE